MLIGGAADLAPSTKTRLEFEGAGDFQAPAWGGTYGGRNMHFGIREHAMAAACNGMSTCKVRPFGSGFLIFSDYARGSIRLSALMELPVIYIFTHDSIGLGEDGPTHQPVEALINLRATPGMLTLRPADANEVAGSYAVALEGRDTPTVIALSRQGCNNLHGSSAAAVLSGASSGSSGPAAGEGGSAADPAPPAETGAAPSRRRCSSPASAAAATSSDLGGRAGALSSTFSSTSSPRGVRKYRPRSPWLSL